VVLIIMLMILVLLVLPIYVLYELSDEGSTEKKPGSRRDFECIGVLLVFTLAFSACIRLFTRARRHEVLAASAA
jgi:hypothetical protein